MPRALITGITGQDGYYLAEHLYHLGMEVWGLVRGQNNPKVPALRVEQPYVSIVEGDLMDAHSLRRAIEMIRPHYVFNLGAITYIPLSWEQPDLVYQTNFVGVSHLLEASARYDVEAFVQASTSEMYGDTTWSAYERALSEDDRMCPLSPYAIAKLAAHHLTIAYRKAGRLNAFSAIMFNHESPRRGESFVTRKTTLAAARIRAGRQEILQLGNATAVRDWGYAPEYMAGLVSVAQRGTRPAYLLATRHPTTVQAFAERVFTLAGIPQDRIEFVESQMRANDVNWLCGNPTRAKLDLKWEPQLFWGDIAQLMLEADLRREGVA